MTKRSARSAMTTALLLAAVAGLLAGCGVRGALENPVNSQTTATADSGQGKKENEAPKPHKDFILDGLLR